MIRMHRVELRKLLLLLLPDEGVRSKRAFALFCAEHVSHLITDTRAVDCLAVVRRRVADSKSISDVELSRAAKSAWAVGTDAADVAGWSAAPAPFIWAALHVAEAAFCIVPISVRAVEQYIQLTHLLSLTNVCWTFVGLVQRPLMCRVGCLAL